MSLKGFYCHTEEEFDHLCEQMQRVCLFVFPPQFLNSINESKSRKLRQKITLFLRQLLNKKTLRYLKYVKNGHGLEQKVKNTNWWSLTQVKYDD